MVEEEERSRRDSFSFWQNVILPTEGIHLDPLPTFQVQPSPNIQGALCDKRLGDGAKYVMMEFMESVGEDTRKKNKPVYGGG